VQQNIPTLENGRQFPRREHKLGVARAAGKVTGGAEGAYHQHPTGAQARPQRGEEGAMQIEKVDGQIEGRGGQGGGRFQIEAEGIDGQPPFLGGGA